MRGIKDKFAVAYFYVFDKKKNLKRGLHSCLMHYIANPSTDE